MMEVLAPLNAYTKPVTKLSQGLYYSYLGKRSSTPSQCLGGRGLLPTLISLLSGIDRSAIEAT
jgi:hypothetical protein